MPPDLAIDVVGYVAVVEIRRPPNNHFDLELIRGLADAYEELAAGDTRAIVLLSEGKNFCAGADFGGSQIEESAISRLYNEALRLFAAPLPVIAAVQGTAVGGGLGLACSADFRVATPQSTFVANFSRLGLHHGFGLTVTLPRIIGEQAAARMLLTGRRVVGGESLELGLVDRLVDADRLRRTGMEMATEIAEAAPLAVRSIRATLRRGLVGRIAEAVELEASEQRSLFATADFAEGVAATAARRSAVFTAT